jgi:hypothetical protein
MSQIQNANIMFARYFAKGIKTTSKLTGYQIYLNYVGEHQGTANMKPAEKCMIKVEGITNGSN